MFLVLKAAETGATGDINQNFPSPIDYRACIQCLPGFLLGGVDTDQIPFVPYLHPLRPLERLEYLRIGLTLEQALSPESVYQPVGKRLAKEVDELACVDEVPWCHQSSGRACRNSLRA